MFPVEMDRNTPPQEKLPLASLTKFQSQMRRRAMSALGQKRTRRGQVAMSAFTPITDTAARRLSVHFGP